MVYNPCEYGQQPKPGAPEYVEVTAELLLAILGGQIGKLWPLAVFAIGSMFAVQTICNNPRPAAPDWSQWWTLNAPQIQRMVQQQIMVWIWDTYVECIPGPNGCAQAFIPNHPDIVDLDVNNATVHGGPPVSSDVIWLADKTTSGGGGAEIGGFGSPQAGDCYIVIVHCHNADSAGTAPNGFVLVHSYLMWKNYVKIYYGWYGQVAAPPWNFWFQNGYKNTYMTLLRNVDPDQPIESYWATSLWDGAPIVMPSLPYSGTAGHMIATGFKKYNVQNPIIPPAGRDHSIALMNNDCQMAGGSWPITGPSPEQTWPIGQPCFSRSLGAVIPRGVPQSSGTWYSWEEDTGAKVAWGVLDAEQPEPPEYYNGCLDSGYHVEFTFPQALGGTRLDSVSQWVIKNFPQTQTSTVTQPGTASPHTYVHPGDKVWEPADPPEPPPDWVPPNPETGDNLAEIAAKLDELEYKLDGISSQLFSLAVPMQDWTGVFSGTFGQNQTILSGIFPDVVVGALEAMSRYDPTERSSLPEATGISGDWESAHEHWAWLITITAVPPGTGWRGGTLQCFDVNSRAEQLGWYTFREENHYLDWQVIRFGATIARAPDKYPRKLHLYLRPGVEATVLRINYWH